MHTKVYLMRLIFFFIGDDIMLPKIHDAHLRQVEYINCISFE